MKQTVVDRYDRQRRIDRWSQNALTDAKVIILGAGALGNEIVKNLAMIGIGHILVADFDIVEITNLSRTVLFQNSDIGRSKAETAADMAGKLNPDIDIRYIHGNLFFDIGLGFYRHCDLVISGLDNIAARSHAGIKSALAGVPFLDGGMWAMGGEVRWFFPGKGPCFECTLTREDRRHAFERRSCTGFRPGEEQHRIEPSTMSTTAVIAGILTQEVVRFLCGWETPENSAIVYNGLTQSMHKTDFSRDPDCPYHKKYQDVIELDSGTNRIRAYDLICKAEKNLGKPCVLELGRDFLAEFKCTGCDHCEPVEELLGRIDESRSICPICGKPMKPEILSGLKQDDIYADRTLKNLGVPSGEVLAVRSELGMIFYELTGDIAEFWH
ncbi:ThiF family adenylyltransferase [Desulfobacterales bacterium HSG16]|nr:ThiF family adenylyltransferase [Desulfobacterales bacterium HSG16]